MSIPILLRLHSSNEFNDSLPGFALLYWTRELGAEIARAREACLAHGYHSVRIDTSAFWYTAIPGADGDIDDDGNDDGAGEECSTVSTDAAACGLASWAAIHDQLEEDGEDYVILTAAQAAELRAQSECEGIRGDKLVVSADSGWRLAAHSKYSGDGVDSGTVGFGADPWAEAHGYPDVRLYDARTGNRLRVRLDPVAIHVLREATRFVAAAPNATVSLPMAVIADTSTFPEEPPPRCVVATAPWHDRHPPGRATFSRFDYTITPADASDGEGVSLALSEWRDLMREAGRHLSLVSA